MKQLLKKLVLFYAITGAICYVLNIYSPNAHDGGPGLGTLFFLLCYIFLIFLILKNLYQGIRYDKNRLVIALIHIVVFFTILFTMFI